MADPIVIVHGWSDKGASFIELANDLNARFNPAGTPQNGVITIDLADWLSLNDEVTYNDLKEAMNRAWNNNPRLQGKDSVNVISHSTGALVVRHWMTSTFKNDPSKCPIKRHVMLAPANFGSPLAHKGKKFYGRLFKGFLNQFKNGLETGSHILDGLELASPFSWDLAEKDVFSNDWYGSHNIMATVLVGNQGYNGFYQITSEEGSDGTVRVSTANLNAVKLTVHFDENGDLVEAPKEYDGHDFNNWEYQEPDEKNKSAFGVIPNLDHGSITEILNENEDSEEVKQSKETRNELLYKALTVESAEWDAWKNELSDQTKALYENPKDDYYHGYQNTVVSVYDHLENPVEEYVVQFISDETKGLFNLSSLGSFFHRKVIRDIHNYKKSDAYRSFYLDVTSIKKKAINENILLNIDPYPEFDQKDENHIPVGYPDSKGFTIDADRLNRLFQENRTLLIKVYLTRLFDENNTFRITTPDQI